MEQLRVLIVDDEDSQAEPLRVLMENNGFIADKETVARKVRTRVRHSDYDVILLDVVMPDYNGIDVLVDVQTFSPDSKVIMISGIVSKRDVFQCWRLGALDFVEKDPSLPSQVYIDKVQDVVKRPPILEPSVLREELIQYLWNRVQYGESQTRGRDLEGLLKLIFESVDGFEDVETNIRTGTGEEIDIEFENNRRDAFWREQGALIQAECKNWSGRKVGPEQYNHFHAKLARTTGRIRLGFLISYGGFSDAVREVARTLAGQGILIALIDRADLKKLVASKEREKLLKAFIRRAIRLHP